MTSNRIRHWLAAVSMVCLGVGCLPAMAWELAGTKTIQLHGRDGQRTSLGTVTFEPKGDKTAFSVKLDAERLKDFFLSMREFKCLEGNGEILCHVPYPYANPATVSATDLAWLEHALLFLFKLPKDFGAKWWNGIYYRLSLTEQGLVGVPEAIDLNQISAPPTDRSIPPYGPSERSKLAPDARWFGKLTIE
jgi:hypothetical protein